MLEQNIGAAFLVPMGVSLAFGVVFATVISLLIVPSGYLIMEDIKKLFSGKAPGGEVAPALHGDRFQGTERV